MVACRGQFCRYALIFLNRFHVMELDDPLIQSVIIHMYLHPEGTDIEELVGSERADEVLDCLVRNGMIEGFP